ncbi:MAG TPA: 1-(5-phosphoribosyl)-5-((5-phosphoribosylamino)methylideneamino)imidazole-4-carboxamide isomerase, partial [Rhodobiaceae bacterium]|nr:1-(5-phosphoribosyl)-5-((5-phosphoribosylamino)methylideneamino)imidazole-4-carboxamide isomerase [Rhodobiaceae bacterium]
MILFPAIDLKGGECVRLEQGDMNRATVFND